MVQTTPQQKVNLLEGLSYFSGSNIGLKREENQDRFGEVFTESHKIFLVADGMGGVKGGAAAAEMAISEVSETLKDRKSCSRNDIVHAINSANKRIFDFSLTDPELTGMGTTIAGISVSSEKVILFNVGDSRIYRIRRGRCLQLNEDHTLVNELLRAGIITADQVSNHPVAHMLTRSLGPSPTVDADCYDDEPGPAAGDIYLICSDGLYNMLSDQEIGKIVSSYESLSEVHAKLIEIANKRGGNDNITITLIKFAQGVTSSTGSDDLDDILITNSRVHRESAGTPGTEESYEKVIPQHHEDLKYFLVKYSEGIKKPEVKKEGKILESLINVLGITLLVFGLHFISGQYFPENIPVASVKNEPKLSNRLDGVKVQKEKYLKSSGVEHLEDSEKRLSFIEARIELYSRYLPYFSTKKDSNFRKSREDAEQNIERLRSEIADKSINIDSETRRLSLWYERDQRLNKSGALKLGAELAGISEIIREKQQKFQEATWNYLKETEKQRVSPETADTAKINTLLEVRKSAIQDLEINIVSLIRQKIEESNRLLSELALTRADLEDQLAFASEEISIIRVLENSDSAQLSRVENEIRGKVVALSEELRTLKEISSTQ